MSANKYPLEGLRVVELARILAGPWIGQTLADLGADVIKIESPDGDDTRRWGPPFVSSIEEGADAAYFHSCNRGKRSVVADLRTPSGVAFARSLAQHADVLIENFKVGGLIRYGLDYPALRALNHRLIYCSVTGFGQTGPYAGRAGYDAMIQAMSGIMDLTGEADGPPQKMGVAFADLFSGLYGVIGIQAALAQRERTGHGQQVDIALLDSMVGVLANQNLNYLVTGIVPQRLGTAHPNLVPYQVFATCDGHVMLAVGNDGQFRRLCCLLGQSALGDDPRFSSNQERVRHRTALVNAISAVLVTRTRAEILAECECQGVPAGPINTLAQVFSDPQVIHRGLRFEASAPWLASGSVPAVRTPLQFSDAQLHLKLASPSLGQHTAEVTRDIVHGQWSAKAP